MRTDRLRTKWRCAFALGLVLSSPAFLGAQTTGAEIRGKVADESGGVLPGVTITVKNLDTGVASTALSGAAGEFRVPALVPGPYEIKAELQGFATVVRSRVELVIGQIADLAMAMKVGSLQETVTVTSAAPLVETSKSGMSNVITKEAVASLPILGRNWQELALLTPGASQPTGSRGAFTAGGTTGRDPNVQVDGGDSNDNSTGSSGLLYSQDSIREFNVMTNRFSAEYGRTQSAAVNVVTKSGTNLFSGDAFGFFRNEHMDSSNWFTGKVEPYSFRQVGGALGGPIRVDKTHFFYVYENQFTSQLSRPNTGFPSIDVLAEQQTRVHMSSARLDQVLTDASRMFVRAAWAKSNANGVGSGKVSWQNASARSQNGYSVVIGNNWVLGANMVNEFRAQANKWYTGTVLNWLGPEYNFPSVVLGTQYRNPQDRREFRYQIRDDLSITRGKHALKLGVDTFPLVDRVGATFVNAYGRYFFRTDPTNIADMTTWAAPYLYRRSYGDFSAHLLGRVFNSYFQDDWQVKDRMTLNLGIRYDISPGFASESWSLPGNKYYPSFPTDKNNWAPRFGLTYALDSEKRTVLRGGAGIYQQQFLLGQGLYKKLYNGVTTYTIEVRNPNLYDPLGGQSIEALRAKQAPGEIQVPDPTIDTPYSTQLSVGFSRELPGQIGLSADVVWVHSNNNYQNRDINLFESCQGVATGCARPDPAYTRILQYQGRDESKYKALLVSVVRRFHSRVGMQVSYTLAKAENEFDDTTGGAPNPPSNMFGHPDWGPPLNDQRHLLVTSGNTELPYGFRLSGIFTVATGMPHQTLAGFDVNGDGSSEGDRPAGWTRNSRRAGGTVKVDLRMSRTFRIAGNVRIEAMFEVYNLFNRHNYDSSTYGTTVGSATFDKPGPSTSNYYQARQGQLGIRLLF